jgi:hypothetical protein
MTNREVVPTKTFICWWCGYRRVYDEGKLCPSCYYAKKHRRDSKLIFWAVGVIFVVSVIIGFFKN